MTVDNANIAKRQGNRLHHLIPPMDIRRALGENVKRYCIAQVCRRNGFIIASREMRDAPGRVIERRCGVVDSVSSAGEVYTPMVRQAALGLLYRSTKGRRA